MQTSNQGINHIKAEEGYREVPYTDAGGVLTVGYGHTGKDVRAGVNVSKEEAEALLRADLATAETVVNKYVTVVLNQHQFDALVSFVYNVGVSNFKTSTLLRTINANRTDEISNQFMRWVFVKGKRNKGLVNRRATECRLYHGGIYMG